MKGYGSCPKCRAWAWEPQGFKETKHFMQCPNCKTPMNWMAGHAKIDPVRDLGYREKDRVEAGLMSQKGY